MDSLKKPNKKQYSRPRDILIFMPYAFHPCQNLAPSGDEQVQHYLYLLNQIN